MPKRGRKPQPAVVHEMRGTRRADRHSKQELSPGSPDISGPPAHLGEHGREFWRWAVDQYDRLGVSADERSLEGMADLWQRWRSAKEHIPEGGFFICERTGNPKRHPAATEAMQCWKELRTNMAANALNMEGWIRNAGTGEDGDKDEDRMFGVG